MAVNRGSSVPNLAVLIPAAGKGSRARGAGEKILHPIEGQPLIRHTVHVFQHHPATARILLIGRREMFPDFDASFADRSRWVKLFPWVEGGKERQDSVRCGIRQLEDQPPDWVLVHDGARPFCSPALVDRVVEALARHPAVVPTLPMVDTVRRIGRNKSEVLDRGELYRCQTPQGFHWQVLAEAHRLAAEQRLRGTDDAQLVEAMGVPLTFVAGEERNIKVTTEEDLLLARALAQSPSTSSQCGDAARG